eukprot:10399443-Karenia_brevis.AAC.1
MLDPLLEFGHSQHTHDDHRQHSESRIDRLYSTLPASAARCMCINVSTSHLPLALFKQGISDHVVVSVCIKPRDSRSGNNRPSIPTWITQHPRFACVLESLNEASNFVNKDLQYKSDLLKDNIHEAARVVRDELLQNESS